MSHAPNVQRVFSPDSMDFCQIGCIGYTIDCLSIGFHSLLEVLDLHTLSNMCSVIINLELVKSIFTSATGELRDSSFWIRILRSGTDQHQIETKDAGSGRDKGAGFGSKECARKNPVIVSDDSTPAALNESISCHP
ncbi:hypothetical protein NPIL_232531 [Nephila pilipes]|uniref:Uncharacterized protein n=1 Tax=Nephila pilipes TaxID=299642 RepID=A0A8X6MRN7_NEPPI|nr:hypothetical protein NPIL_232531 [Nephila pilipes]